mgnify:CR=1 FL=1
MKIILSTTNPSKVEQIRAMFKNPRVEIFTLQEAGILGEAIEDGETLEENALKKARFAHNHLKNEDKTSWTMADDTGIFIDTLNGEPGVKSARWAGENVAREEITEYCLKRMENVKDRSATFKTVAVLVSPEGKEYVFYGEVKGSMLNYAKVKAQPKMPYSPLFMPEGTNKVLAEMTVEEENKISHRGRAFKEVVDFLEAI